MPWAFACLESCVATAEVSCTLRPTVVCVPVCQPSPFYWSVCHSEHWLCYSCVCFCVSAISLLAGVFATGWISAQLVRPTKQVLNVSQLFLSQECFFSTHWREEKRALINKYKWLNPYIAPMCTPYCTIFITLLIVQTINNRPAAL